MAGLPGATIAGIDRLLAGVDLAREYRTYRWKGDSWKDGFVQICTLERRLSDAARKNSLGQSHAINVAAWGGLPNTAGIQCREPLNLPLYKRGLPAPWLRDGAENVMRMLEGQIRGFGPTYCSKMLRFAVPSVFGAIDTRIVRVFGADAEHYRLLDLQATRSGPRWAILSAQEAWPADFGTWTMALHQIADRLNGEGTACPHPPLMVGLGLREPGVWLPADVEMAMFSYALAQTGGK
ncbi:hypothetical protein [Methanofollis fontis]|uniref:Uncharacterized protein n=1 Tax=Methanofollis fontis TaxID=2052832 RepID=A0A483CMD2_9EURY|nr:hypothetical protein [Methanofollis fontis]TAJ44057.1 hypothetical protein CUJ86_08455 [Methanofollis fontis]